MLPFTKQVLAIAFAMPCSCWLATAASNSATPTAPSPAKASAPVEIPKSVFEIPANPQLGRNPFFPTAPQPVVTTQPGTPLPTSFFILNGITSPPKRTAMINGRTFEIGESGEVRAGTGKILIKCEDIRDDSAVISIEGKRMELRLRFGL